MKNLIGFIVGVLLTLILVYANIPGLDKFIGYREAVEPKVEKVTIVTKEVKPDTVYQVKTDTLIFTKVVDRLFRDTLYTVKYDTIYLENGKETVSERLFEYPYATFAVRAYSPLPVRAFTSKAEFDYNKYLKDHNYVKNPVLYFGLTEFEWKLLAGGIGIGAVGWEIVR